MNEKARVLIIDDEKNYLLVLQTLLEDEGYDVTAINDPEMALAFLGESEVDVVVTDMKMPKVSGEDVLKAVKRNSPQTPVLIMTAFGAIESAVDVMKIGAFDYITKPFSNDELLLSIHNAVELSRTHQQYRLLREELESRNDRRQIVGSSRAMRDVLAMVERLAPSKSAVLITGESGTGKEMMARAIHYASPRKDKPFVVVNCANAEGLEEELFGVARADGDGPELVRRGRFEQAAGGALFLDDIGELSPELQVKLLKTLQESKIERVGSSEPTPVDVRVLAASDKSLAEKVEKGQFRDDLYYKFVALLPLPPLRERREDAPLLVARFVKKIAEEKDLPERSFSAAALNYLSGYDWPGNIRQLENVVESAMALARGPVIDVDDLPAEIRGEESQFKSAVDLLPARLDLADTLEKIEAAVIRRALAKADLVQVKAAEMLGISKSLLQYKLKKYGITGH